MSKKQRIRPARPDPVYLQQETDKPSVYVFDMDGTLALLGGRNPYDASQCDLDPPHAPVVAMARRLSYPEHYSAQQRATNAITPGLNPHSHVVIVSARFEKVRAQTERWLVNHGIAYRALFMRTDGDNRKDALVKAEILRDFLLPNFRVETVFDDRDRVVEMWRWFGIPAFQVQPGDF